MEQKHEAKLSYRAKQQLGQNFLMHQKTADRIVGRAQLPEGATVVEIGPGTGMLTHSLLAAGMNVIAVEADGELIPGLLERFEAEVASGQLDVIHGDIRSFDFDTLSLEPEKALGARRGKVTSADVHAPSYLGAERVSSLVMPLGREYGGVRKRDPQQSKQGNSQAPYFVVANIPYYITGEIIRLLLTATNKPASITLLVQKEVAERVARAKKESLLSLSVKTYGTPKYLFTVPRGAFRPAPKVDSAVLYVGDIHSPFRSLEEESFFFDVLHAGFGHKRKKLIRNLEDVALMGAITEIFTTMKLSENVRSEELTLGQWSALSHELFLAKKLIA